MDSTPAGADTVLDRHFDDLDAEFAATRRLLERFPAEHADFKPHEKSMSLAVLASHVATLPQFAALMLNSDEHDMAATPSKPEVGRTAAELLAMFDRSSAAAREAVANAEHGRLGDRWKLRMGEMVFIDDRRGKVLRQHLVSHAAHHRGQLTVYYRLLGVPVPGMYGPSADER
ncbi:MAG TPA: DinB family protein [Gemmatirosa sp.]